MFVIKSRLLCHLIVGMTGIIFFTSCNTINKPEPTQASWLNRMHRLSATMSALAPLASENGKFYEEKNNQIISAHLSDLAKTSAELAEESSSQKNLLIHHAAKSFAQDMAYASVNFERGNPQVAQFVVSNMSSHCINCHTSMDRGTKDFPIGWATNLNSLNPAQKTQFYLANRQYKSALNEVHKLAKDKQYVVREPESWRQTVERTLAMLVRVEGDATEAGNVVQAMIANTAVPAYIKRDSMIWKRDIELWKADKKKNSKATDKLAMAKKLIKDDKKFISPQSHSELISNLRASALLQEVLTSPSIRNYSEGLYYAGINAELLPGLTPWSVSESYYEACIRSSPHSGIAMKCYAQLEAATYSQVPFMEFSAEIQAVRSKRLTDLYVIAELRDVRTPEDRGNLGRDY